MIFEKLMTIITLGIFCGANLLVLYIIVPLVEIRAKFAFHHLMELIVLVKILNIIHLLTDITSNMKFKAISLMSGYNHRGN